MRPTRRTGRGHTSLLLAVLCILIAPGDAAEAKVPGRTYCYKKVCHRVLTLSETEARVGHTSIAVASHYDDPRHDRFNPSNLTSSGALFRPEAPDNAASPILPNGTKVLVWHPRTGRAVLVRINNSGPYWKNRTLDLSRAAAERIGLAATGIGTVHVRVVQAPTRAEAAYRRGRTYPPVQGYLGQFASLDAASAHARSPGAAPTLVAAAEAAVDGPFMTDPTLAAAAPAGADRPSTGLALASASPAVAARGDGAADVDTDTTTIRIALVAARPVPEPAPMLTGQQRLSTRSLNPPSAAAKRLAEIERQAMRDVLAMLARR